MNLKRKGREHLHDLIERLDARNDALCANAAGYLAVLEDMNNDLRQQQIALENRLLIASEKLRETQRLVEEMING